MGKSTVIVIVVILALIAALIFVSKDSSASNKQLEQWSSQESVPQKKLRWGSQLDGQQTDEQNSKMLAACPANRRVGILKEDNFTKFMDRIFDSLSHVANGKRPITYMTENFVDIWEKHQGLMDGFWAEYGVFRGDTLAMASHHLLHSDRKSGFKGVVAGFDSFQGLPVAWRGAFAAGTFGEKGEKVDLAEFVKRKVGYTDVEIYKGWFQSTIPEMLNKHPNMPATFIHHDGDLFVSTAITFQLLANRIVPGTMMCFDELQGYPGYEQHEILALYLWMMEYNAQVCSIAIQEPYPKDIRNYVHDISASKQSSCFQVLSLESPEFKRGGGKV